MIEAILPDYVVATDVFEDPPDAKLFPQEEEVILQAVDKRRKEFTTARVCARSALRKLGRPVVPILPGLRGEPQWPQGVVGSITHCAGYRAAVLGASAKVMTVGIDAEPNDGLANGVLTAISLPEERDSLRRLTTARPDIHWDRMLFSAKESVYKAWFPIAKRWLDFEDAHVTIDPARGTFTARLLVAGPRLSTGKLTGFTGRWLVRNDLILTAIVVPAPALLATA
ncbi:4'-phosphopantetheinyl transferase superfamily protein [Spongiactinospora sp. TRM90649]|uniref:4'-phosphopantetheinyl transferase family protein n=1 Tax=Spongiactinospora sp. TRM90649 TaxID=3031114 RepID=UPI0023F8F3E0|nr:4'-phosphopantetheinyl transferase superfamily protein [Spongiactinospora sp. TRM90649]MDF5752473.1 4'-phosphopantetheinyl transferase superfamily protein [Spongiactinospora sp. TRM90649]